MGAEKATYTFTGKQSLSGDKNNSITEAETASRASEEMEGNRSRHRGSADEGREIHSTCLPLSLSPSSLSLFFLQSKRYLKMHNHPPLHFHLSPPSIFPFSPLTSDLSFVSPNPLNGWGASGGLWDNKPGLCCMENMHSTRELGNFTNVGGKKTHSVETFQNKQTNIYRDTCSALKLNIFPMHATWA